MKELLFSEVLLEMPLGYAYHKMIFDENNQPEDYVFVEVNAAFEELTGLRAKDILGKRVSAVLSQIRDEFDWIEYYGNVVKSKKKSSFEQYSLPLGKWYKVFVCPVEEDCFVTVFSDITEEKDRVKKHNAFFNNMNDVAALHEVIFDQKGNAVNLKFLEVNDRFEELTGRKRKNVINILIFMPILLHPDRWQ